MDHTRYWLKCYLGLDDIPQWYSKRYWLCNEIANLFDARQAEYWESKDSTEFKRQLLSISRRFHIKYSLIYTLLGVASTDPSNTYGVLCDFLRAAEPKIKRTNR